MNFKLIASGTAKEWHVEVEGNANGDKSLAIKSDKVWLQFEPTVEIKEVFEFLKTDSGKLVIGNMNGTDIEIELTNIGGRYINFCGATRNQLLSVILRKKDIDELKKCFEEVYGQMVKSADTALSKGAA